jgi:hypothetical protein
LRKRRKKPPNRRFQKSADARLDDSKKAYAGVTAVAAQT